MNWFKLFAILIQVGSGVADIFIKSPESKKTKEAVTHLVSTAIVGLANESQPTVVTVADIKVEAK